MYSKGQEIMREGGFNLRKWHTNFQDLQTKMSTGDEGEASTNVKMLGINWDTDNDELHLDLEEVINYSSSLPTTKRSVVKLSAKIFGLLSPTSKIVY